MIVYAADIATIISPIFHLSSPVTVINDTHFIHSGAKLCKNVTFSLLWVHVILCHYVKRNRVITTI